MRPPSFFSSRSSYVPWSQISTEPAPYWPFGISPFERGVFDRMVFDVDGQMLLARLQRDALGNGPAGEGSIPLEAKVVVQSPGVVPLDDEDRVLPALLRRRRAPASSSGRASSVFGQLRHGRPSLPVLGQKRIYASGVSRLAGRTHTAQKQGFHALNNSSHTRGSASEAGFLAGLGASVGWLELGEPPGSPRPPPLVRFAAEASGKHCG